MRPWGPIGWLLDRLPGERLVVAGCLASEERSIALPLIMVERGVREVGMLRVRDAPSHYTRKINENVAAHRARLGRRGIGREVDVELLTDDEGIVDAFWAAVGQPTQTVDLVLDITCVPKRFFFLMVKLAMKERRVGTLVVAYTQAREAGYTEARLAEDPDEVRAIPGFGPMHDDPEMLIVGLGFEPLGLGQLIGEYRDERRDIQVLMPFPPGQPYSRRIWRAYQALGLEGRYESIHRVSAVDAFDSERVIGEVARISGTGAPPALAPYGPKPMSLGMCLYALREDAQVLYTQPRIYHPEYTRGVGRTWGYCLKTGGRATF